MVQNFFMKTNLKTKNIKVNQIKKSMIRLGCKNLHQVVKEVEIKIYSYQLFPGLPTKGDNVIMWKDKINFIQINLFIDHGFRFFGFLEYIYISVGYFYERPITHVDIFILEIVFKNFIYFKTIPYCDSFFKIINTTIKK